MALVALKGRSQDTDFLTLIKAATQAPSGHNSQQSHLDTNRPHSRTLFTLAHLGGNSSCLP